MEQVAVGVLWLPKGIDTILKRREKAVKDEDLVRMCMSPRV